MSKNQWQGENEKIFILNYWVNYNYNDVFKNNIIIMYFI